MKDAALALQEAVRTALINDGTLMGIITAVYDSVPDDASFPYIEIADPTVADYSTKTSEGEEHTIELHIWSNVLGNEEVFKIRNEVKRILHNQTLSLTDHTLVNLLQTSFVTVRDIDPATRQGVYQFRAVTEEV